MLLYYDTQNLNFLKKKYLKCIAVVNLPDIHVSYLTHLYNYSVSLKSFTYINCKYNNYFILN